MSNPEERLASWIDVDDNSDFSLNNLPYGVFSTESNPCPRCGVAIGDFILDLSAIAGLLCDVPGLDAHHCFSQPTLNAFMSCPRAVWQATRARLIDLLSSSGCDSLRNDHPLRKRALCDRRKAKMHMPVNIGDYTDFYSSREHATRVGTMLRDANNPLQPNWLHLPVAYHGRTSSVVLSGHNILRPCGQLQKDKQDPKQGSFYGPTKSLDYELEMGFFVGGPATPLGSNITMKEAEDHIFGMVLLNDWSARDIQAWEYVPLGPFGAKNFATTISPWVVTMEALEPFRCPTSAGTQDPVPLEYLRDPNYDSYDIKLEDPGIDAPESVAKSNFANMYWNIKQQLVHHTVTGCSMRPGDLLGSGTISGSDKGTEGCLMESSWRGTVDVPLGESGKIRRFLEDGDTVTLRGWCQKAGGPRVGFGEAVGTILPAGPLPADPAAAAAATLAAGDGAAAGMMTMGRYHSLRLHTYWRSSCTWRVRTALAAKGLQYEHCVVNLVEGDQHKAEYTDLNPMKQVPVLELVDAVSGNKVMLRQSMAIIEFLEEAFPPHLAGGVRLLPAGPLERARAREMAEVINSGTQPLQNFSMLQYLGSQKLDTNAWAARAIQTGLSVLEKLVVECGGSPSTFCMGRMGTGAPTIVDMFMVPQMYNGRRYGVQVEAVCPTLAAIDAACQKHPWFIVAHPSNQPDAQPVPA